LAVGVSPENDPSTVVVTERSLQPGSHIVNYTQQIDILIKFTDTVLETLRQKIRSQIEEIASQVQFHSENNWSDSRQFVFCKPYHFVIHSTEESAAEIFTHIYPTDAAESDSDLVAIREKLHNLYSIPIDRSPLFRRQNAIMFSPLFNEQLVYDQCPPPPKSGSEADGRVTETVKGTFAYFHYMQDSMNDDGWGCAYRSLQTVWSWFLLQGYTEKAVLNHRDIQQTLVDIGDKESAFVGSKNWIGSFEVSYVLDQHLGVTCAFINVQSGDQLKNHATQLANHFRKHGTPVMVGGGVLAHTICGVSYVEYTDEVYYLILDPHYIGSEDPKNIKKKGAFAWKPQSFWKSTAYYNLCLPQRPRTI
jgi:hypothetical protein